MIDQIQRWSALAGLPATIADAGPPFRVRLSLEDIRPPMAVEVQGPTGADDPYRFHTGFELPAASVSGLPATRVSEIVEAAVLGRSALADARRRSEGTGVELIAVIYPDGLTRHSFMTAIYECQKLRQIITREVEAALVAESALTSLLALAETSEDLAATLSPVAAPAPYEAPRFAAAPPAPTPVVSDPPVAPAWPGAPEPAPSWPDLGDPPPAMSPPVNPMPVDPRPDLPPGLPPRPREDAATPADAPPLPTWDPPPLPDVPPPLPPGQGSGERA